MPDRKRTPTPDILGSLLGDKPATGWAGQAALPGSDAKHGVRELPTTAIVPNPRQPRQVFSQEKLEELAASIAEHGVLEPIIVRPADDKFLIVAGERRYRASVIAGRTSIPAIVRDDLDERTAAVLSVVENLQREDLDIEDEARQLAELQELTELSDRALAEKLGKHRSWVNNRLRLLRRRPDLFARIREKKLTLERALSILPGEVVSAEDDVQVSQPETHERADLDKQASQPETRGATTQGAIQFVPWRRRSLESSYSVFERTDWRTVPEQEREEVLTQLLQIEEQIERAKQVLARLKQSDS